jgi:O-antigen/teichoic acid export membrane protein
VSQPGDREISDVENPRVDGLLMRVVRSPLLSTSATNMAIAGGTALGGILLARGLGPHDRGVYAGVFVWMAYLMALTEGGLNAAVVYFVSKAPAQLASITRLALGGVVQQTVVVISVAMAVVLALDLSGSVTQHYLLGFALLVPALVSGIFTAGVYGSDLRLWNLTRALQVPVYTGGLLVLALSHAITVDRSLVVYGLSVSTTGVASVFMVRWLARRTPPDSAAATPLVGKSAMRRYAIPNAAWVIPTMTNVRIDQMALSVAGAPTSLGVYAVASTWALMASPAIGAIGNVVLPQISSQTESHARYASARQAVRRASVGGAIAAVLTSLLAWPAIHLLFGSSYAESVRLSILLAPAAWGISMRQVSGDVLRGVGKPHIAAITEGVALLVGAPLLLAAAWLSSSLAVAAVMSTVSGLSAWIMARQALTAAYKEA